MSFRRVRDPSQLEKITKEFVRTRKEITSKIREGKRGEEATLEAIQKLQAPVVRRLNVQTKLITLKPSKIQLLLKLMQKENIDISTVDNKKLTELLAKATEKLKELEGIKVQPDVVESLLDVFDTPFEDLRQDLQEVVEERRPLSDGELSDVSVIIAEELDDEPEEELLFEREKVMVETGLGDILEKITKRKQGTNLSQLDIKKDGKIGINGQIDLNLLDAGRIKMVDRTTKKVLFESTRPSQGLLNLVILTFKELKGKTRRQLDITLFDEDGYVELVQKSGVNILGKSQKKTKIFDRFFEREGRPPKPSETLGIGQQIQMKPRIKKKIDIEKLLREEGFLKEGDGIVEDIVEKVQTVAKQGKMTLAKLTNLITEMLSQIGVIKGSVFFKEMMKLIKDQLKSTGVIRGRGVIRDAGVQILETIKKIIGTELSKRGVTPQILIDEIQNIISNEIILRGIKLGTIVSKKIRNLVNDLLIRVGIKKGSGLTDTVGGFVSKIVGESQLATCRRRGQKAFEGDERPICRITGKDFVLPGLPPKSGERLTEEQAKKIFRTDIKAKIGRARGGRMPSNRLRRAFQVDPHGNFGKLKIDLNELARLKLVARKNNKVVINKATDFDLLELVLKRFNPKTRHSASSITDFKKLVMLSELPLTSTTGKVGLISTVKGGFHTEGVKKQPTSVSQQLQLQGTGHKIKGSTIVKVVKNTDEALERLNVLIGSLQAGNNSDTIKNEAMELLDILLNEGEITRPQHKQMTNKILGF